MSFLNQSNKLEYKERALSYNKGSFLLRSSISYR
nr:MAG TPA: hypothetical protein [Caudoviricetes sp.]